MDRNQIRWRSRTLRDKVSLVGFSVEILGMRRRTGVSVVIIILRADLAGLEVLVLDLGKSNHCGCLNVCWVVRGREKGWCYWL